MCGITDDAAPKAQDYLQLCGITDDAESKAQDYLQLCGITDDTEPKAQDYLHLCGITDDAEPKVQDYLQLCSLLTTQARLRAAKEGKFVSFPLSSGPSHGPIIIYPSNTSHIAL